MLSRFYGQVQAGFNAWVAALMDWQPHHLHERPSHAGQPKTLAPAAALVADAYMPHNGGQVRASDAPSKFLLQVRVQCWVAAVYVRVVY